MHDSFFSYLDNDKYYSFKSDMYYGIVSNSRSHNPQSGENSIHFYLE